MFTEVELMNWTIVVSALTAVGILVGILRDNKKIKEDLEKISQLVVNKTGHPRGNLSQEHGEIVNRIEDSQEGIVSSINKVGEVVEILRVISDKEEYRRQQLYDTPQNIQAVSHNLELANKNILNEFSKLNKELADSADNYENLRQKYNDLVERYNLLIEKNQTLEEELQALKPKSPRKNGPSLDGPSMGI